MKKSALSAIIIATLFACSKDLKETQVNIENSNIAAVKGKVDEQQSQKLDEKTEKKPLLIPDQGVGAAYVNEPVTVTFTAVDAITKEPIGCGKVTIYQWDGTEWDIVAVSDQPKASYSFTPTTTAECAYKFRAGFAPAGANACQGSYSGVDYATGSDFCVVVQEKCVNEFTIAPHVAAVPLEDGQYEFTVTYTLTSPVDIDNVKFQGGATAGGTPGSVVLATNATDTKVNNNNTVLTWVGSLKACTPQKVWFKYKRNFNCSGGTQNITGQWSASAIGLEPVISEPLSYSCN